MRTYFTIKRNFSPAAFKLKFGYSVDGVDTLALDKPAPTPIGFLNNFSYSKSGGEILEDMLANDLSFRIFSDRIANILEKCSNREDIELLRLPAKAVKLEERLLDYRILGIKKQVACVNLEESEILWGAAGADTKHILSFRECILNADQIPENLDIFLMAEYPVIPVISANLATEIARYHPTGFVGEKIRAI